MKKKKEVIDKISSFHPAYGQEKGWATYVGGMADTGHWYKWEMLDVPLKDLEAFLEELVKQEEEWKKQQEEDVEESYMDFSEENFIVALGGGKHKMWMKKWQADAYEEWKNGIDRKLTGL